MLKEVFRIISIWIVVLPLVAGFINFRGLNNDSRWIFFLVLAALAPQLLTFFINKETWVLNASYNIYTIIEFVILFLVIKRKYNTSLSKYVVFSTVVLYAIIALILFVKKGISNRFLNDLVCVNNIVYMIWILFLLKEQFHTPDTLIEKRNPFAWYLLALLIYSPCTVFAFSLYHYMREGHSGFLQNIWIVQSICNILLYLLFSVGLFISDQKNEFA